MAFVVNTPGANSLGVAEHTVALILALLRGDPLMVPLTAEFWGALIYLSLFGSVIAFAAYITLMSRVGAGRASYNGVIIPIVALVLSTFFEGYRWEMASIFGCWDMYLTTSTCPCSRAATPF